MLSRVFAGYITLDVMSTYRAQFMSFRRWNHIAMGALVLAMPLAYLSALVVDGSPLSPALPIASAAACVVIVIVSIVRIRLFRCPRCGKKFTVRHPFGANGFGRNCVHCGLSAWEGNDV
jgi:hypothetical protein